VGSTALRALPAALLAGLAAYATMRFLPLPSLLSTLLALAVGGLASLPLIWREVRMLFRL
jgi:hypothetical protein